MNTAEQILVILLSGALAILMVVAIFATINIIRLVQSLRRISESAEHIIHSAESVGELFKKAAGPASIFHFIKSIIDFTSKSKDKREKEHE